MTIIETHYVDQTEQFIKLYNQGQSPKTICQELGIGMGVYHKYRQNNIEKLNTTQTCPICNKRFTPRNTVQIYCTPYCRHTAEQQGLTNKRKAIKLKTAKCPVCGETFTDAHINRKYCSDKCRAHANYIKNKQKKQKEEKL